jgi:hypothetical protein
MVTVKVDCAQVEGREDIDAEAGGHVKKGQTDVELTVAGGDELHAGLKLLQVQFSENLPFQTPRMSAKTSLFVLESALCFLLFLPSFRTTGFQSVFLLPAFNFYLSGERQRESR